LFTKHFFGHLYHINIIIMRKRSVPISIVLICVTLQVAAQSLTTGSSQSPLFNVCSYGARGDGQQLDSPSVNRAIDAASEAGGGIVYFPSGTYLSGSIRLKSNITLYLDQGASIVAIQDTTAYDKAEPNEWGDKYQYQDFGHSHWHNSLIWGENLEKVAIMGPGLIYGKGLTRFLRQDNLPNSLGNKAISMKNCNDVTLRDFSILHGGHFGILLTGVDNLTIDNLKIDTNRDGIDVDCCRNVKISNCSVNSPWDDAICLKSSFGLGYARSTEDVNITNCWVSGGFEEGTVLNGTFKPIGPGYRANFTGRIKFGTESNAGGFKNITISNCIFESCQGLALESVDGALLEDVTITNITMRNIISAPIFIRLGSRMRGPEGVPVGKLHRIIISNIVAFDTRPGYCSIISGIPGFDIEDVQLNNIQIYCTGGGTSEMATIEPPERENAYPEPGMFGSTPAYGFYIRHANRIEFNNVQVSYEGEEARPPFSLKDVKNVDFMHVRAQHAERIPAFVLQDVSNFRSHFTSSVPDTVVVKTNKIAF
jgi:polygalacturonase